MINFEEELKKYRPVPDMDSMEESIQNQDLDDMADEALRLLKEAKEEAIQMKKTRD